VLTCKLWCITTVSHCLYFLYTLFICVSGLFVLPK